ncbi:CS1-pili formation C-terminal domain-containing protein [Serratia odorifera]|uniref:CS1-pili formation C-terminal domain-containing protein n=1 Tax=Serratia odorifera TaxID=618 RepID=UPI0035326DD7
MPFLQLVTAIAFAITLSLSAVAQASQSLASQAADMPAEFREHFFNAPISARVVLDGKVLGDAMIVLTEDDRAQIIQFTDPAESSYPESERQRWLQAFSSALPLGQCDGRCPHGLMAVDYNLSDARLVLITPASESGAADRWFSLPESGSSGLLLNNQLSISGSRQQTALGWTGGAEAATGSWTTVSQYQLDRSSGSANETRHAVTSLYSQREFQQHFVRAGLFTPDSQGLLHQPYSRGGGVSTLVGAMVGSSETLLKDAGFASLYPVYVTANREGVAEVYRDGSLINAQPVAPGMQMLDTTVLPAGIYDVEIRVLEDGRESSRVTETINKPMRWRNTGQRLRYNLFAGQQRTLFNSDSTLGTGEPAAGASLNYLLHPRATLGLAWQKIGKETQIGSSLDFQPADALQFYGNLWNSSATGYGFDSQAVLSHHRGNVAFGHSRSWFRPAEGFGAQRTSSPQAEYNSVLSATWRFNSENNVNARITHHSRGRGPGVDVGYSSRTRVAGTSVNWRLSGFDRPYQDSSALRNRGVSLSLSFPLGGEGRSGSVSVGSRTDTTGTRDLYASASVSQQWGDNSIIRETSGTLTADRHGASLSTYNSFNTSVAEGSFWGQRSSVDGGLSGGLNTGSTLAFGKGKAVMTQQVAHHQGGGMIVDVVSDDDSAELVALHQSGGITLKPGRNFIPVEAWKPGTVQLDFPGTEAPALKIQPEYLDYHHIRGGVSTHQVRVMKTVTVMGRLVNREGLALGGAQVINHAGRTVTESDGVFTLELHEKNPVVTVEHPSGAQCEIRLNPGSQKQEDMIFAGNLTCDGLPLADSNTRSTLQDG